MALNNTPPAAPSGSPAELDFGAIERRHVPLCHETDRGVFITSCQSDMQYYPCDALQLLAALRRSRAAEQALGAALRGLMALVQETPIADPDISADAWVHQVWDDCRAALAGAEGAG